MDADDPMDTAGHFDHTATPEDAPEEQGLLSPEGRAALRRQAEAQAAADHLRTDTTDQAPNPDDPTQAAEAAAQRGVLPPGGLALLGPEVASEVRHQLLPDGSVMIVLRLEHATGATIVGLSMGHALQLSNNLRAEHRKAELAGRGNGNGKLIVPGVVPPPGNLRAPGQ